MQIFMPTSTPCSGDGVYIPNVVGCHNLLERVEALEARLGNKVDTNITMTDVNNNTVTATVLAEVS